MAKCDEGYLCEACGKEVENITESDLYLRYVIGELDPEMLHVTPERHIHCNPILAQFIVDNEIGTVAVEDGFGKDLLDTAYVQEREALVTRGWKRLREIHGHEMAIIDYPLPEIKERLKREAEQ